MENKGLLLAFSVILLVCAACSGDAKADSVWLELLRRVPDTPERRSFLVMNDYKRLRELSGLKAPARDAPIAVLTAYLERLAYVDGDQNKPTGLRPARVSDPDHPTASLAEFGFNIADLDQDVEAGEPPRTYTALRGRFDANLIDHTVREEPRTSPMLTVESHEGVKYYRWGEDLQQDLRNRTVARPLGIGGRLAQDGDYLYWTAWTDGLRGMIDAKQGQGRSLADFEDFKLLADGLLRLNAYSATLTVETLSFAEIRPLLGLTEPAAVSRLQASLLRRFTAVAAGSGQDKDSGYAVVVLVHPDEASARENVGRLNAVIAGGVRHFDRKPWRELIRRADITSSGRLLLAKLRTDDRRLALFSVLSRETLLVHE